jgi:methionyl-tRNA synthetase
MNPLLFSGFENLSTELGLSVTSFWIIFGLVTLWTLVLKGFALWYSARNHQRRWFIVLLILNTFGLLELAYLIWFRKDRQEGHTPSLFNTAAEPETEVT